MVINRKSNCDKSCQIVPNHGEFVAILKSMEITPLKLATDRITEGIQKNNGDHYGGQILALFSDHFFLWLHVVLNSSSIDSIPPACLLYS